ncbi:type III secretion system protein [Desulfovibrio oxamicus]|uniref:Type III secretion system protein n=1 Tax=Nitratidesulfovibrio oxamicus TaxID=32016 RepID=A0ABS0J1Q7_9BACT|nr:type III secretion system translocon subunit SctB [Nitratidesulfovibrio oxamicus]MBG3876349.1 type III secretion system protein [Nitratidesulfovibrio oxamicus]
MSTITNVRDIPGFNPTKYDALVESARSENVDVAALDMALLRAVNAGSSFSDAVGSVTSELPRLVLPHQNALTHLGSLSMAPSPGATLMSLITSLTSEERRQNADMRKEQTEAIVDQINAQADEMRSKAVAQLVMGVVSGAISIAQGFAVMSVQASGMKQAADFREGAAIAQQHNLPKMSASFTSSAVAAETRTTAQLGVLNSGAGGINSALGGVGQAVGGFFDAAIKEMDGNIERMRAARDAMKDLDESLSQLIQKTLSSMDAIQQNMNQTRARILG